MVSRELWFSFDDSHVDQLEQSVRFAGQQFEGEFEVLPVELDQHILLPKPTAAIVYLAARIGSELKFSICLTVSSIAGSVVDGMECY
jgi:hypothetical protein